MEQQRQQAQDVIQGVEPPRLPGIFGATKTRTVTISGVTYRISLRPSLQRGDHRFELERYALVECDEWRAVVPSPQMVADVDLLWYREIIELIERAQIYVRMRAAG